MKQWQLIQMIVEAHDACKSECMDCPWCSGRVCHDEETHDEWCTWPAVKAMADSPPPSLDMGIQRVQI